MPAFYKIDKDRKLILITGSDHISLRDALALQEKFRNDPDFNPAFAQLVDLTQVRKLEFNPGEIRQIAGSAVAAPGVRRAFLANDDVAFGLARMFESYRESMDDTGTRVFRELDQALNWALSKDSDTSH
jgi:hypothetical protein